MSSTLRSHLTRHALLQHLHDGRDGSTYRFTDQQVKVLGHDHIAGNNEIVFAPDFFKNLEEEISSSRRFQELSATIATACNEMEFTATMKSLQPFGHEKNIVHASTTPTLRFAKSSSAKDGAPTSWDH